VTSQALLDSSLVAWQDARGARWGVLVGGGDAVIEYGDAAGEVDALREGCGLIDLAWCDRLIVGGADRQRFLNAYLTCDVKDLAAGGGAYGFFTNAQGRILADAVVAALDDQVLILLPPARGAAIREHLARFLLADRVELRSPMATTALALVGPRADEVLALAGAPVPAAEWAATRWSTSGGEAVVQRLRPWGETAYLIWGAIEEAAAVATRLVACGARPVGSDAFEVLRVESGVPRFGVDYDEGHFPQETGLEHAVSFTKGCYLGQEVVARIHYRGHVNRRLCGVAFDRDPGTVETPRPNEPLLLAGEEVGKLGSVVVSARLGRTIGLAVLRAKAATPGTALATSSGLAGAVAPLPFVE
jgi:folate-binding protein YgfZ